MELQEGNTILCEVENIQSTVVFVKLPDGRQGTIITSEIAPGRIKNIRQYVKPHKKIVCKVLNIKGEHIHLSLRRVTAKERQQIMQQYKQEKTLDSALKQNLKDDFDKTKQKILGNFESLYEFAQQARENQDILKKYIPKQYQDKIKTILEKRKKQVNIKEEIQLKCYQPDGIKKIKSILNIAKQNIKIIYISAGKFTLTITAEDYKQANKQLKEINEDIENKAKKDKCEIEIKQIKK